MDEKRDPVDILREFAEQMAKDLGVEVDEESFARARQQLYVDRGSLDADFEAWKAQNPDSKIDQATLAKARELIENTYKFTGKS